MRPIFLFIIYLNICSIFGASAQAQNLKLIIAAEKPVSKSLLDSLQLKNIYSDYSAIKSKADTIHLSLQRIGYIDSELLFIDKINDSLFSAHYFLGKKYSRIKIFYPPQLFTLKQLQRISTKVTSEYFELPIEDIPIALKRLTDFQNEKGDAFAKTYLSEIEKNQDLTLKAYLKVTNSHLRTIDSIIIRGYEKFPRSFLKYYSGIKTGNIFDKQKLLVQNDNLNNLGFVSTTKSPEILFRKDSTNVYLYLEKKNNNQFDGILGFATDEETQKVTFNGFINLELNNNLNFGEQFLLNYLADEKDQLEFKAKLELPYLFKTPFGAGAELKIFKRDSSFITTDQKLKISYQISPSSSSYIGYRSFTSSNLMDQTITGAPIENFKSKFITAGWSFQKNQNRKIFPVKTLISTDFGYGNRDRKSSSETQFHAGLVASNIFNLNNKNSIYARSATNILFSDTYLINEIFRFGGINSIRGFEENSIDASMFSVLNTEYRYQFNPTFFIHSIIDLAYFENQTLLLKQKLYSFGIGLGLTTKAGLFRLIIANGVGEDQELNLSNIKIHISLSTRF